MKFFYSYRTSSNEICENLEIFADSRDDVYNKLKSRGIRPFSVKLAPGIFNRIAAVGRRGWAIIILAAGFVFLVTYLMLNESNNDIGVINGCARRQLLGDAVIIEKGIRTGWSDVFILEGDRFLASYAIPGSMPAVRLISVDAIESALRDNGKTLSDGADSLEGRQICAIVAGIKDELRAYIKAGGSVQSYVRRLNDRQDRERRYYEEAKKAIAAVAASGAPEDELISVWEQKNAELRKLGIRLVSLGE